MNTGQVLLVIIAFVFLSTVLLNFNRTESMTSDSIYYAQDGILLTTVAQSYDQIARGLPFGAVDDTTYITPDQIWRLTPPADLGPDNSGEHTLAGLNDFDDFNGQTFEREIVGSGKRFRSSFRVYYVDPFDITQEMSTQTWVKRMDVRTWQSSPPLLNPTAADTLTTFVINGYYHFN